MDMMRERVTGLDIHKKKVVACWMRVTAARQREWETRAFGTMTGGVAAVARLTECVGSGTRGDGEHSGLLEAGVQPTLIREWARVGNRVEKLLESTN